MATDSRGFDGERQFSAPGVEVTMLAGTDETDGVWSLFEYEAEAGFEGYFAELASLMAAEESWPPADVGPSPS